MRKAAFAVLLVLLLLAGLVAATGAAGQGEVEITVWFDGRSYNILPGEVAVPRYGWGACSPGLVRVFIKATNWEFALLNEAGEEVLHVLPEEVDDLWGPLQEFVPEQNACVGSSQPTSSQWRYVLEALDPGEYELHSQMWLDHPLIDGGDYDGDGRPDLFKPEEFARETVNFIIVHEE